MALKKELKEKLDSKNYVYVNIRDINTKALMIFWKRITLTLILEEETLSLYKEHYKALDPFVEPDLASDLMVKIQTQEAYVHKLKKTKGDIALRLDGFTRTLDDIESGIFVHCIMNNEKAADVAKIYHVPKKTIYDIKSRLLKQLKEMVVEEPL